MISVPGKQQGTTRRGFVKELTGNAAGLALAGILSAAFRPIQESIAQEIGGSASRAPGSKYRKCFLNELTAEEREVGYGGMKM
ncbi:MAG: twin-arginine translocation signal domain-containing protein, partial [Acidobacteria bacterium]|nr:twin-arginine translocation signal domain-containing protein [Acidobacteriota bacterium]